MGKNNEADLSIYSKEYIARLILELRPKIEKENPNIKLSELSWEKLTILYENLLVNSGLEKYFNNRFDVEQLYQISLGLKLGLDVSVYATLEFNTSQMIALRETLLHNKSHIDTIAKNCYDELQMNAIYNAIDRGLDVSKIADTRFNGNQMSLIVSGMLLEGSVLHDFDVDMYAKPEFKFEQMSEILQGLKNGKIAERVHLYADPSFGWKQMWEIRKGLEAGVDVSMFLNAEYSAKQMEQIRLGLEKGLDVSEYAKPTITFKEMDTTRRRMLATKKDKSKKEKSKK